MTADREMATTTMTTAPSMIDQFLTYLRSERHFSAYTRAAGVDLEQFGGYLLHPDAGVTSLKPGRAVGKWFNGAPVRVAQI